MGALTSIATRAARRPTPIDAGRVEELTAAELDVLALMARGLTNAAIAEELIVSRRTVEAHVNHLFLKLDLRPSATAHRRVLAANAYVSWQQRPPLRAAG